MRDVTCLICLSFTMKWLLQNENSPSEWLFKNNQKFFCDFWKIFVQLLKISYCREVQDIRTKMERNIFLDKRIILKHHKALFLGFLADNPRTSAEVWKIYITLSTVLNLKTNCQHTTTSVKLDTKQHPLSNIFITSPEANPKLGNNAARQEPCPADTFHRTTRTNARQGRHRTRRQNFRPPELTRKMVAVSIISAKKVDTPLTKESAAPTRAITQSITEMTASSHGTKDPICAIRTATPTWERQPIDSDNRSKNAGQFTYRSNVGRLSTHVGTGDDHEAWFSWKIAAHHWEDTWAKSLTPNKPTDSSIRCRTTYPAQSEHHWE